MIRRPLWTSLPLALLLSTVGCAPQPSSVPLGLGPLAVAEQNAELSAAATRRSQKPARPQLARAAETEPSPSPVAKADAKDADEKSAGHDADEKTDAKPASGPAFEGMYAGTDIAVYRSTGLPEREDRDDKAKIRIEKAAAGSVSITLINSDDGSDLCEIVARVEGNAALIESAQPCFGDGSEGNEGELTSGRAVLEGDRLKMDAQGTLSLTLPDQELDYELTYSFKGERQ
jgi:hypothetical protein